MYLETLAGYIFDDDILVTYKWLSKELGVHVNLSKQILWHFLKEHEKGKEVKATYTLMGYLADGVMRVEVVKEENLSSAKKKFVEITAEHLYSLQRALPDIESLALSGTGDHRLAAIICTEIIPRKDEELLVLRWGSRAVGVGEKDSSLKSDQKSKTTKSSLNNFFGKVNDEKLVKQTVNSTESEVLARGKKRQGSEDCAEKIKSKRQKRESEADSRSAEESSDDENDQPAEADPREDNSRRQSPPRYKIENGKKKVRKVIDKSCTDGDGYFVTNKEYVYESCSDDENQVIETPKNNVKDVKKVQRTSTVSKTNRNKQASLLNFFKKS